MARHLPVFKMKERELMNEVFSPEVLRPAIPKMSDLEDGAAKMREMHEEIGTLGKFQKAAGFTGGREMQLTAKIDENVIVMLDALHEKGCDCGNSLWGSGGHKEWFLEWLRGPGKQFDVRGKIVL